MRKQNSNAGLTFYFTVNKRHSTSNLNLRTIHNFLTQLCINFQKYDFLKIIMKYLLFISFWLIINFVTQKGYELQNEMEIATEIFRST